MKTPSCGSGLFSIARTCFLGRPDAFGSVRAPMPRPRRVKASPSSYVLSCRLSPSERLDLERVVFRTGLRPADLVRAWLAAAAAGLRSFPPSDPELGDVVVSLASYGADRLAPFGPHSVSVGEDRGAAHRPKDAPRALNDRPR